jgi:hypothetical protein
MIFVDVCSRSSDASLMNPSSLLLQQGAVMHPVDPDVVDGLSLCGAIDDSLTPIP